MPESAHRQWREAVLNAQDSWIELATGDTGSLIVHCVCIGAHMLMIAFGGSALIYLRSQSGFDEDSRVIVGWIGLALGAVIMACNIVFLSLLRKLEKRAINSTHDRARLKKMAAFGICMALNFAAMVSDFVLMWYSWNASAGRWVQLILLGAMEMIAGLSLLAVFILHVLKMRRISNDHVQVYHVLGNLEHPVEDDGDDDEE